MYNNFFESVSSELKMNFTKIDNPVKNVDQ